MNNVILILIGAICIFFYLGFALGRYIERYEWNKLIAQGKLPKPGQLKNLFSIFQHIVK